MDENKKELLELVALLIQTVAAIVYLVLELKPKEKPHRTRNRPKKPKR